MDVRTHRAIDHQRCGTPESVGEGTASVSLVPDPRMAADEHGLVHGGFVFGLADHAAMLAINEPTVVLGSAQVRLTAPVRVGQRLLATATLAERTGKRHEVDVEVRAGDTVVLTGRMTCFVPPRHVLASKTPNAPKEDTP
ncbi:MAG: PaaI family thioesterase [Myxococcales bacterium]|nr:PaaI family thioesterase [Myxococcales bacterium]